MSMLEKRDNRLDVVRGLAIIAVVWIHTAQVAEMGLTQSGYKFSEVDLALRAIAEFGKYGVELFFFLSGTLLGSLYGSKLVFSIRDYTKRRLARILPLWWVFAIGSFLLFLIFNMGWWKGLLAETPGGVPGNLLVAVSTLFFATWLLIPGTDQRAVQGGWSIESEMAHYAIFPWIRLFSTRKLILTISICGFLAFLNDYIVWSLPGLKYLSTSIESLSILTTLPFFIAGILLVKIKEQGLVWGDWRSNVIFFPFSLAGFGLLLTNNVPFGLFWEAAVFVLLSLLVAQGLELISSLRKVLVSIGKYSYFTYFFHFYLISGFVFFQPAISASSAWGKITEASSAFPQVHLTLLVFSLATSQLIGFFSYKYFEGPILRRARSPRVN
jgi:peptidoglycan/LPS O-acetylase OafA/YrhL